MAEEQDKKNLEKLAGEQTRLIYECAICENTFDKPGMCQSCKVLLKQRGG